MSDGKRRFQDNVILITGGTSGIGLATAVQFAAEGAAHVIVCGRRRAKWDEAQNYIQTKLSQDTAAVIQYWPCDVRIESQISTVVKKIFETFGRLDVCFNNAGVQPGVIDHADSGLISDIQFQSMVANDGAILYRLPPPQPESQSLLQLSILPVATVCFLMHVVICMLQVRLLYFL